MIILPSFSWLEWKFSLGLWADLYQKLWFSSSCTLQEPTDNAWLNPQQEFIKGKRKQSHLYLYTCYTYKATGLLKATLGSAFFSAKPYFLWRLHCDYCFRHQVGSSVKRPSQVLLSYTSQPKSQGRGQIPLAAFFPCHSLSSHAAFLPHRVQHMKNHDKQRATSWGIIQRLWASQFHRCEKSGLQDFS